MTNTEMNYLVKQLKDMQMEMAEMKKILIENNLLQDQKTDLIKVSKTDNIDARISHLLFKYKIQAHLKGYRFLREAIKMVYYDESAINGITKFIYPDLARKFKDTPSRVERAIRHAIECSWCHPKTMAIYDDMVEKPSNSEFIALLAELLRVEGQEEIA